jgi:hypothetical protein
MSPDIHIFAPDLLASQRWYADVFVLEPVACGPGAAGFDLVAGATVYLSLRGRKAEFTLFLSHAPTYAERLRNRVG